MLGGLDPIIIFQFKKLAPSLSETVAKIPVVSEVKSFIEMPPIPIYFSRELSGLTGIYIDGESKNIEISTDTQGMTDGSTPQTEQSPISTVVSISMFAKKDSLSVALLSSLIDLVYDKTTSKEYAITYLNGPITIFGGLLHSFSVDQNSGNDLLIIKMELTKGNKTPTKAPELGAVQKTTGLVPL